MCGIFGVISQTRVDRHHFVQLAELNKQRGNLAFGGISISDGELNTFRFAAPFLPEMVPDEEATVLLGHIRAPTGGRSNAISEVHPFASKDGLLAHNGLLLNQEQFPEWRLDTAVNVDSQIILGGIQAYLNKGVPTAKAIQQTVEKLDGQQACWYWSKPEQRLYLWRVMSPIFIGQGKTRFVFSSIKNKFSENLIPEGTVFQFDPKKNNLKACERFLFYSPYQVN